MAKGYRFYLIVIAGLTLVGASDPSKHSYDKLPTVKASKEAGAQEYVAPSGGRIGNALDAQSAKTDPFEKERNEREIRNLKAQEKSAFWTEAMFWASALAVFLSVIGIWLVWTTFRETRKANQIADDIGFKQLRAYVTAESAEITSENFGHDDVFFEGVKIGLHNSGSTPAISVALVVNKLVVDDGEILPMEMSFTVPDIGSQARQSVVVPWYCREDFYFAQAALPSLIEGRISYVTAIPDPSGQVAEFNHPFKIEPKDGGRREAIAVDVVRWPTRHHF